MLARKIRVYKFVSQYFFKKTVNSVKRNFPSVSTWYSGHFPAVRINNKPDPWEYGLNFSSEAVVGLVVLLIAAANLVVFNPLKKDYVHKDNSLAAHFLGNHSEFNDSLHAKQNTVNTTVANNRGLFAQVFADNTPNPSVLGVSTVAEEEIIDDSGITKANPDSIQKLVSQQVQVYETKPFDTVYTVATQFGISTKTIRESNGLPDHALKAGWHLVIPPVEGIVVKVETDLSLYDISKKYQADLEKVVSYNGLEGPDSEIALGEYLIIPGGVLPEPPKPVETPSAPSSAATPKATSQPSVPRAAFVGSNKFAAGHCTAWVASKVKVYWRGNASAWMSNAKRAGATVNQTPKVGSIIQTNESRYGHVGYIEAVNGTKVTFSEWNYKGLFIKTTRTLDMSDSKVKGIIHP